jgi:uncharacterized membrane protein YgcG
MLAVPVFIIITVGVAHAVAMMMSLETIGRGQTSATCNPGCDLMGGARRGGDPPRVIFFSPDRASKRRRKGGGGGRSTRGGGGGGGGSSRIARSAVVRSGMLMGANTLFDHLCREERPAARR